MTASGELKRERDNVFMSLMSEAEVEPDDNAIGEESKIKPWMIPQRDLAPIRARA